MSSDQTMIISGDFFTANHNNTHWRIWTGNLCHWLGEGSGDHHLCLDQQINQQEEQSNPNQSREIVWSSLQLLILKIICKNLDRKKEIQVKLEDYSDKETQFNLTFILDLITYGEGRRAAQLFNFCWKVLFAVSKLIKSARQRWFGNFIINLNHIFYFLRQIELSAQVNYRVVAAVIVVNPPALSFAPPQDWGWNKKNPSTSEHWTHSPSIKCCQFKHNW